MEGNAKFLNRQEALVLQIYTDSLMTSWASEGENEVSGRAGLNALLILLGCISVSTVLMAESLEEIYFETRNKYIQQFEKSENYSLEDSVLADLDEKLKVIIGPVNIEGFPKPGRINLETLHKDFGFGHADGLRFDSDSEYLFVTTNSILKRFLNEKPNLPKDLTSLSKTEDFYRYAFFLDSRVALYAVIPVKCTNEESLVYAFLGLSYQDIGPFIPEYLYVFVSSGNRILLVMSPIETEISEIPQCRNEWDKYAKISSEELQVYLASQLENEKAFEDHVRYEKQGFEAYHRCYERESKNQPFFISLKEQAQSIVDRLLKE
jgi:hypothetical protein